MILKIFAGIMLAFPFLALAANPSVSSFTSSTASIYSGQVASLSWRMADAGGYSFIVPCIQGIKLKKTDGTPFACDTKMSSVLTAVDGIDLIVQNISGYTKNVTVRIIPKDATGIDYDSGRQDLSISVATAAEPIESFIGATSTPSFVPYPITWTSGILDGVNLSISCSGNIRASSTSYAQVYLPCNVPIFATDLTGSGTLNLNFSNSSTVAETVILTLLPAMAQGAYDGGHSKKLEVSVRSNIAPDPIITSFISGTTFEIIDQAPVAFTWTTEGAPNTNLHLSCNSTVTASAIISNATTTLPCDGTVFATPLPASGTTNLYFSNKNFSRESITVSLLPGKTTGGFDGTRAKSIILSLAPKGATLIQKLATTTIPISTTTVITGTTPTTPTPNQCSGVAHYNTATGQPCLNTTVNIKTTDKKFLTNLRRGMKHPDVRTLQEFLKTDRALYPEGIVNGVYGPATERAVGRMQVKHNIVRKGGAGYGSVGPKTRTLINSLTE